MTITDLLERNHDRIAAGVERKYFAPIRTDLLGPLTGRVLEVGMGTGLNLGFYRDVTEIVGVEPSARMREQLRSKVADAPFPVKVVDAPGERLPFGDSTFDAVVCTLVLCEVDDLDRVLSEARRVLAPGGRLVFLEHVRNGGLPGRVQDLVAPVNRRMFMNCRPNRKTLDHLRQAGFTVRLTHWVPRPWPRPPANGPYFGGIATLEDR
jgi:ubiquinone/menaquinone biosynthesis C-methylase UbiE